METFCGIDWAEDHHDIALVDRDGGLLARARISDDAGGLARLLELLAEHGDSAESRIPVAIETPRGLLTACLRTSRPVYAINPMAVARYRDRHSVAGRKSDHGDAVVLASVLRTDIITAGTPAECKTAIEALTAEIRITQEGIVPVFKIPPPGTLTPGSHTDDLTVNPVRATVHPVGER